jgi:hypothetical protein
VEYQFEPGMTYPWSAVSSIHSSLNGICQKNGRVVSLLTDFGRINPCYPDFHGSTNETIHYTGSGRRGDQKLDAANRAMLDAIRTGHSVPLFNKLDVNRWEYLGLWHVTASQYVFDDSRERMVWKFTLCRTDGNTLPAA